MKRMLLALMALSILSGLPGLSGLPTLSALAEEPLPTEPLPPAQTTVPVAEYTYAEAASKALGLRLVYPSHWENLPGRSTICFREPAQEGKVSARMAISVKKFSKRPTSDRMETELISFLKAVVAQYDSYEVGNLSTETGFMGKTGYSTIYKGLKDGREVRGYVIMAGVGTKIYAYHFSADSEDYAGMATVMERIRDGIKADN